MKLIKNGKILRNGILKDTEILIDGKRIKTISSKINSSSPNIEVIDAKGNLIAPGFVDVHVHLREPGGNTKKQLKLVRKQQLEVGLLLYAQCLIQDQYQTQLSMLKN